MDSADIGFVLWAFVFPAIAHIFYAWKNRKIPIPATPVITKSLVDHHPEWKQPRAPRPEPAKVKIEIPQKPKPDPQQSISAKWEGVCCMLPERIKPRVIPKPAHEVKMPRTEPIVKQVQKFAKPRSPRKSPIQKPQKDEWELLKQNAQGHLRMRWIEIAHLKTFAVKRGIDDWISLVDSKLSYEENRANIEEQYGKVDTDGEMMHKWKDARQQAEEFYNNQLKQTGG